MSVAERSVNRRRFLVTRPGDLRSENADMSNEKSCEKHDRLPVEGFLRSVHLRRVNRSLRNPRKGCRWVHESDEVALTTEPCLSQRANGMIGLSLPLTLLSGTLSHPFLTCPAIVTSLQRFATLVIVKKASRKKLRIGRAILPRNGPYPKPTQVNK